MDNKLIIGHIIDNPKEAFEKIKSLKLTFSPQEKILINEMRRNYYINNKISFWELYNFLRLKELPFTVGLLCEYHTKYLDNKYQNAA